MSDDSFLSDPELAQIERRLSAVAMSPTTRQREKLLFACGRAAGRAEMRRPVYAAAGIAAVCLCLLLGLAFNRTGGSHGELAEVIEPPEPVPTLVPVDRAMRSPRPTPSGSQSGTDEQLTAAMDFDRFFAVEDSRQPPSRLATNQTVPGVRILTAADLALPDNL